MKKRDHPREYGENLIAAYRVAHNEGPSPRIRGECWWPGCCWWCRGTIPANTGRMLDLCGVLYDTRDHPREYGENSPYFSGRCLRPGPSPRIRGECNGAEHIPWSNGTIPANTGRMCLTMWFSIRRTDHPREYGENAIGDSDAAAVAGPSPRIRGESRAEADTEGGFGTIPANTGRITGPTASQTQPWDHPREYGENADQEWNDEFSAGPSPRIRGEFVQAQLQVIDRGTIPANTGRIASVPTHDTLCGDHPREYGENRNSWTTRPPQLGPSPRIRGELAYLFTVAAYRRTIPANTGRIE